MPKPDNRADNPEKLADMIDHTMANLREARDYLKAHGDEMSPEEREQIEAKNRRREQAIEGFRREIKDEVAAQKRQ